MRPALGLPELARRRQRRPSGARFALQVANAPGPLAVVIAQVAIDVRARLGPFAARYGAEGRARCQMMQQALFRRDRESD